MRKLAHALAAALFTSVIALTGAVVTDAPASADTGWNGT